MRRLIEQGVSVQMCVTSPPYFGLRDYGHPGQLGRQLLADDGSLWLNLGDTYGDGKQLLGIPWRVALALQYYWNADAMKERAAPSSLARWAQYGFAI